MFAVGCLLLVVLPLMGLALGGLVAGPRGATIAALAGFAVALAVCGVAGFALMKAGRRR